MATFEITIDDQKIQDLLQSDQGMAALLQPILNQLLQAEMTEHLGAEPGERHEEWSTGRRYLTMDAFFEWKASVEPEGDSLPVAA
jgi:transposase-like protein